MVKTALPTLDSVDFHYKSSTLHATLVQRSGRACYPRRPPRDGSQAYYTHVKLLFTLGQRYFHSLPQLLEAFAAQLFTKKPTCTAQTLQDEHVIQQVVHQELSLLQQPLYEVAITHAPN